MFVKISQYVAKFLVYFCNKIAQTCHTEKPAFEIIKQKPQPTLKLLYSIVPCPERCRRTGAARAFRFRALYRECCYP